MKTDKSLLEEKANILKTIAHPIRLCILRGLFNEGENNVSYMQGCLDVPQSTLSQHLGKMRVAGIVKGDRRGNEVYYSIENEEVKKIIKLLFN